MNIRGALLSFLLLTINAGALGRPRPIPPLPTDFSKVDVYLGTRDVGHQIYTKYGHTIVRIVDHENKNDIAYNWGTFDFNEPGFIPKFLKGILIYRMSFSPWWQEIEISDYERQTMWMERVNLTSKQKEILVRRLNWNAQPENIKYPYLFFYDNCATRVRDLLDEALGGKIKERFFTQKSGKTFRDRVLEFNASEPIAAMGQDVILSSEPDREMTAWDDMFVPTRLREYLLTTPAYADSGDTIPNQFLISETKTLTQYPTPSIPLLNGFALLAMIVGTPAIVGTMLLRLTRRTRLGIRLVGLSGISLGALWAFLGLFMSLSWAFGSHTVLPRNTNLWLMWPLDILYVVAGMSMLVRGKPWSLASRRGKSLAVLTSAHMLGILVLAVLTAGNFVTQDSSRVLLWFGPLTAIVAWSQTFPAIVTARLKIGTP